MGPGLERSLSESKIVRYEEEEELQIARMMLGVT
jgi:hypothetical protein